MLNVELLILYDPAILTPRDITIRTENVCLQKNLDMYVHSGIFRNSQKAEMTQISINW